MGATLKVVLEGVLGLVPDKPFFEKKNGKPVKGKPTSLTVLVPDLRVQRMAGWEVGKQIDEAERRHRAAHFPVLLFNPLDVVSSDLRIDGLFLDRQSGRMLALHLLGDEVLTLPRLNTGVLTFEGSISNKATPPKKDCPLRKSMWWVPRMSDIAKDDARYARKELLTTPAQNLSTVGLAARVHCDGGRLEIAGFNQSGARVWAFGSVTRIDGKHQLCEDPHKVWDRAIGNEIVLKGEASTETVTLIFDSNPKQELVLRPVDANSKTVEIVVANAEPEVLILGRTTPFLKTSEHVLPDPDFEEFYLMSGAPDGTTRLVPLNDPDGSGPDGKPCVSGIYSGSI